jgi:hypothetical protein
VASDDVACGQAGSVVYPLGLEADGRLRIRDDTGKLNHLVAEYLY